MSVDVALSATVETAGPGERTTRWTRRQKDGAFYESPVDLDLVKQCGTRDPVPSRLGEMK